MNSYESIITIGYFIAQLTACLAPEETIVTKLAPVLIEAFTNAEKLID